MLTSVCFLGGSLRVCHTAFPVLKRVRPVGRYHSRVTLLHLLALDSLRLRAVGVGRHHAGINKISVICVLALLITVVLFATAGRGNALEAPKGVKNFAETLIEFVQNQIVMQTMGREGLPWTPLLVTLFSFIFLTNITGIIPTFQMPANARIGGPLVMALLVWVIYIVVAKTRRPATSALLWRPECPSA